MRVNANGTPRGWRKQRQRGVSPIIATILLVAITVVLAAVLYILISGLTKGPGNTPIGTALAMGHVLEGSAGGSNWYNSTAASAGGGMLMNSMTYQIQGAGAAIVTPAAGTITVFGVTGCSVAVFTFATNAWTVPGAGVCAGQTTGGTAPLMSGEILSLKTTTALSGDTWVVFGQGSFSGQVSVSIP